MSIDTDTDLIEELAKQVKNPTTIVIGKKRYDELCKAYTPNSDEFETIRIRSIVTSSGNLVIQVTYSSDNTLAVR